MSKPVKILEAGYQTQLVTLARALGWTLMHHCRPARRADGRWSTPIEGNPGYPDLVLVPPEKGLLLFAEVKATDGKLSPEQRVWLEGLAAVARAAVGPAPAHWPTVYVRCFWPEDLLQGDAVQAVLEGRSEAAVAIGEE